MNIILHSLVFLLKYLKSKKITLLLANSAKQSAVIKQITPPIRNEKHTEGPAIIISYPINKKKFEPIFAPKP